MVTIEMQQSKFDKNKVKGVDTTTRRGMYGK